MTSAGIQLGRLTRLHVGASETDASRATGSSETFVAALANALRSLDASIGDVIVGEVLDALTREKVMAEVGSDDSVLVRSTDIWDIYESSTGNAVLQSVGSEVAAHHTQIRWLKLNGADVAQISAYPKPDHVAKRQLWVDPAVIVILVPAHQYEGLIAKLSSIAPLWERLRSHHGSPLRAATPHALATRYPVSDRHMPLSDTQWQELCAAVRYLDLEVGLDAVVDARQTPQRVVEQTLSARRTVHRHNIRLSAMLDHSHGSIHQKYEALSASMTAAFPDGQDAEQLLAPHRHLRDSFDEVRAGLSELAEIASETASLVASTTVGRLLDRSDANRITSTAVAALLAVIALVSTFTAIAAIPDENLRRDYLVRLACGIGLVGVIVVTFVVALARLSARRTVITRQQTRRAVYAAIAIMLPASVACLAVGALTANLAYPIVAGVAVIVVIVAWALINEF